MHAHVRLQNELGRKRCVELCNRGGVKGKDYNKVGPVPKSVPQRGIHDDREPVTVLPMIHIAESHSSYETHAEWMSCKDHSYVC